MLFGEEGGGDIGTCMSSSPSSSLLSQKEHVHQSDEAVPAGHEEQGEAEAQDDDEGDACHVHQGVVGWEGEENVVGHGPLPTDGVGVAHEPHEDVED